MPFSYSTQTFPRMVHNLHVAGCEDEDLEGIIVEEGRGVEEVGNVDAWGRLLLAACSITTLADLQIVLNGNDMVLMIKQRLEYLQEKEQDDIASTSKALGSHWCGVHTEIIGTEVALALEGLREDSGGFDEEFPGECIKHSHGMEEKENMWWMHVEWKKKHGQEVNMCCHINTVRHKAMRIFLKDEDNAEDDSYNVDQGDEDDTHPLLPFMLHNTQYLMSWLSIILWQDDQLQLYSQQDWDAQKKQLERLCSMLAVPTNMNEWEVEIICNATVRRTAKVPIHDIDQNLLEVYLLCNTPGAGHKEMDLAVAADVVAGVT
ncbi:hypothetical protein F5I97DRAFT_1832635 [Phlebopus sp. FC_14]|nr:hypothetical protein F5I97DRAFT_1832635 [Phlebopus sp. FC_14]